MNLTLRPRGRPLDVLVAVWFRRDSGFVQCGTRILWLWGERGFPLTRWPRWYAVQLIYRLLPGVEWDENWRAWPHCCGQARCWMHTSAQWCDCRCTWCKLARRYRRLDYSGKGLREPEYQHPDE
jgi:hypothetical protein